MGVDREIRRIDLRRGVVDPYYSPGADVLGRWDEIARIV
jgi:hypothetical protein